MSDLVSMKNISSSFILLLFLSTLALSGQGVAYSVEMYVADTKAGAARGDMRSQVILGIMYETGFGMSPDPAKAFEWFLAAANRDDSSGQFLVGRAYADGRGVPPDDGEALVWFRKGAQSALRGFSNDPTAILFGFVDGVEGAIKEAERGNVMLQSIVGEMYLTGHGVEQSDAQAARWLALAGTDGLLALMYEEGRGGLPKDKAEAMRRYRKAAEGEAATTKSTLTFFCAVTGRADCWRTR